MRTKLNHLFPENSLSLTIWQNLFLIICVSCPVSGLVLCFANYAHNLMIVLNFSKLLNIDPMTFIGLMIGALGTIFGGWQIGLTLSEAKDSERVTAKQEILNKLKDDKRDIYNLAENTRALFLREVDEAKNEIVIVKQETKGLIQELRRTIEKIEVRQYQTDLTVAEKIGSLTNLIEKSHQLEQRVERIGAGVEYLTEFSQLRKLYEKLARQVSMQNLYEDKCLVQNCEIEE